MNCIQPLKIDITPVHDVKRTRFNNEEIKDVNIMNLTIRDGDKRQDITS